MTGVCPLAYTFILVSKANSKKLPQKQQLSVFFVVPLSAPNASLAVRRKKVSCLKIQNQKNNNLLLHILLFFFTQALLES